MSLYKRHNDLHSFIEFFLKFAISQNLNNFCGILFLDVSRHKKIFINLEMITSTNDYLYGLTFLKGKKKNCVKKEVV